MKKFNSKLVLAVAFTVLTVGCGKSEQFQVNSGATPYNPNIPGNNNGEIPVSPTIPGSDTDTSGVSGTNVVSFQPVSIGEFNSYVAIRPLNAPTNFKLTVDLQNVGNGRYGGSLKISYTDTGYQYEGNFESGTGTNQSVKGLHDNGLMEAEFNRWFIINNKYYFSAYFQDAYGAIVLVVDNFVNQGDAQGVGTMSGSVYYKNFAQSYAQQSPYRKCWYIYTGPFSCRSDAVINKTSAYPSDGFRKLGTFSGLSKEMALKQ